MATFRVFVSRHFIDVCHFDIESPTQKKAVNAAKRAADTLRNREQSRINATDNGWIPDDGITIEQVGHPNPKMYGMRLFQEDKKKGIKVYLDRLDGHLSESAKEHYEAKLQELNPHKIERTRQVPITCEGKVVGHRLYEIGTGILGTDKFIGYKFIEE